MATNFLIGPITFPNGDTPIPARNIPSGTTDAVLTLDVSNISAAIGQSLTFNIGHFDTVSWSSCIADFTGPWLDRHGSLHSDASISCGFGSVSDASGNWVPIVSGAGWQVRAVITAVNGPISSAGGSLQVF